jgi:hypothetical protein
MYICSWNIVESGIIHHDHNLSLQYESCWKWFFYLCTFINWYQINMGVRCFSWYFRDGTTDFTRTFHFGTPTDYEKIHSQILYSVISCVYFLFLNMCFAPNDFTTHKSNKEQLYLLIWYHFNFPECCLIIIHVAEFVATTNVCRYKTGNQKMS